MRNASPLGTAFLLSLLFAVLGSISVGQERPNVIIVLVDDLGWTDLGCQGSRYYETPAIDRLAAEGMRFTDAYAACAVCSPTRAAVMTGRYPARTGVTDWIRARFQRGGIGTPQKNPTDYVGGANRKLLCPPNPYWMEHEEVTIAEMLGKGGYVSAHIGKWHLGDDAWYPQGQGFTENHGGCDYGQPPSYFDPYQTSRLKQGIPHLPPRKAGEYLSDREAYEAVSFIRRNKDRPFFLHLAHYAVHTPIQAKADVAAKYEEKPKTNQKNAKYAAMVESVDDAMREVTAALRECGIDERTIIIFTSDNGGLLGPTHNAPLRSGKGFPHEGGIRVPLIVKWPGVVKPGTTSSMPVCSVDYLPTIAAATGAKVPDRAIDGVSLVPHLASGGVAPVEREALYWHFPHYRGRLGPYGIVRSGDHKLIKRYEGPTFELYDLASDLSEKEDLSTRRPELVKKLDGMLMAHLKAVGARMPRKNPRFRRPDQPPAVAADAKRVLILGDSISIGYWKHVRKALAPSAAVFRPMSGRGGPENCQGTNHGVQRLGAWLDAHGGKWDLIHFNFGLHDLKRVHPETGKNSRDRNHPHQASPERYGRQLEQIVQRLKKTGAKLVFATTTPVPKGAVRPYRGVGDAKAYNAIATAIMKKHGIEVNDLYRFAMDRLDKIQQKANVHFTPAGSKALGDHVTAFIRKALAAGAGDGADWRQFRGARGDGEVAGADAPLRWNREENVRWRVALKRPANGSPIVVGDRIFLCMAEDEEGKGRSLYCFDRRDGREVFVRTVGIDRKMPTHRTNPYCGSTPASDGERVVVWHASAGLHCYDLAGKPLWSRELGVFSHHWGYGTSPVFHDGKLILHSGPGEGSFVAVLDPKTGKTLWRANEPDPRDEEARRKKRLVGSWCTPVVTRVGGVDQVIVTHPTRIVAYDLRDGRVIWWCSGLSCDRGDLVYSSPVVIDDVCMVRGGYDGPSIGVRLGGEGDVTSTHRLWRHAKRTSNVGSGVAAAGRLFMPDIDSFLSCVDPKTGEVHWRTRFGRGQCWGSVVKVGDRLYVMNQKGATAVIAANADRLELLATNELEEDTNATPVFVGDEVIIRTHDALYCISDRP